MAASNSSAARAYDLSAYQPAPRKRQNPQLKVVGTKKSVPAVLTARAVCYFSIVVTLFALIIYNNARLTEVTADLNQLDKQLEELKSENVVMTSTLESVISLQAIAEQAKNELGMERRDQYKTEYVVLNQEDEILLTDQSPSVPVSQRIRVKASDLLEGLQEYIPE